MSNADIGKIIQVVLHDEATNQAEGTRQPAHQVEGARQPAHQTEGARQPTHEAEGARQPAHQAEGARQLAHEAEGARQLTHQAADITVLSDSISATSPLGPVSPLMGSFSLGSTDMDISSNDSSLETGEYIVK